MLPALLAASSVQVLDTFGDAQLIKKARADDVFMSDRNKTARRLKRLYISLKVTRIGLLSIHFYSHVFVICLMPGIQEMSCLQTAVLG